MIAHISGEVTDKQLSSVVVDVSGVGYQVYLSESDIQEITLGSAVFLFTHMVVRETSQELYGFLSSEAKKLFEMLLGVSGVGPKVALSILGLGEPAAIKSAIAGSNVAYIQSANGVSKRGAEKVIVELKDKVGLVSGDDNVLIGNQEADDALSALLSLGYNSQQASKALAKVSPNLDIETRIKQALVEINN